MTKVDVQQRPAPNSHLELYHVRHRVYDPLAFRWLQPDPAGFVDGMNLYAYCNGDPINGIDPLGLSDDPEDGDFRDVSIPDRGQHRGWLRRHFYAPGGVYQGYYDFDPNDTADSAIADKIAADHTLINSAKKTAATTYVVVDTASTMIGATILILVPGPEDVVIAAIFSRTGIQTLGRIGSALVGFTKEGKIIALAAEDAAKLKKPPTEQLVM